MESKYENLEKLNDLYKQGIISENEYSVEKQKILGTSNVIEKTSSTKHYNNYCAVMHLTHFADYVLPGTSLIAPIVMWAVKKDESELVDINGKIIFNWKLSMVIYSFVFLIIFLIGGGISIFTTAYYDNPANMFGLLGSAGFALIPLSIVLILNFVFTIIGAVKASNGEVWDYPLSIRFFKTK